MIQCCCGCTANYAGFITLCSPGHPVAGATVVIKDHATGAVLDTVFTDGVGHYSGSVPVASGTTRTVDRVITYSNGSLTTNSLTVTCGTTTTLAFATLPLAQLTFSPVGCFGATGALGPTLTAVLTLGGFSTSVLAGQTVWLAAGTYSYTIASADRYNGTSGSITINPGSNCSPTLSPTLTPQTGYACFCQVGYPVPTTLNGSWNGGGTFTVVYNSGTGTWDSGNFTASFPGTTFADERCFQYPKTVQASFHLCHPPTFSSSTNRFAFHGVGSDTFPCADDRAGSTDDAQSYAISGASITSSSSPPFAGTYTWSLVFVVSGVTYHTGGVITMTE